MLKSMLHGALFLLTVACVTSTNGQYYDVFQGLQQLFQPYNKQPDYTSQYNGINRYTGTSRQTNRQETKKRPDDTDRHIKKPPINTNEHNLSTTPKPSRRNNSKTNSSHTNTSKSNVRKFNTDLIFRDYDILSFESTTRRHRVTANNKIKTTTTTTIVENTNEINKTVIENVERNIHENRASKTYSKPAENYRNFNTDIVFRDEEYEITTKRNRVIPNNKDKTTTPIPNNNVNNYHTPVPDNTFQNNYDIDESEVYKNPQENENNRRMDSNLDYNNNYNKYYNNNQNKRPNTNYNNRHNNDNTRPTNNRNPNVQGINPHTKPNENKNNYDNNFDNTNNRGNNRGVINTDYVRESFGNNNPLYNRPGVKPVTVDENKPPITNKPVTDPPFDTYTERISGESPEILIGPDEEEMSELQKKRYLNLAEKMCDNYKSLDFKEIVALPLLPSPDPIQVNISSCVPINVPLVIGGRVTTINEFPHMALVGWKKIRARGYAWKCGGSLLSDKYVLTAGHCTYQDKDYEVESGPPHAVQLGSTYLDNPNAQVVKISAVIRHPKYKIRRSYYDVALIKLIQSVKFSEVIRPACMGVAPAVGRTVIATGWGRTEFGGDHSVELRSVSLPVWDMGECREVWGTSLKLPTGPTVQSHLCAGERKGGKDTCQGDSGGPAQIQDGCVWRVVAVTSYGRACGAPNTPALYALTQRVFVAAQIFGEQGGEIGSQSIGSRDKQERQNSQKFGNQDSQSGSQNRQPPGSQNRQPSESQNRQSFGSDFSQGFGSQHSQGFGSHGNQGIGNQNNQGFGSQSSQFGSQSSQRFGSQDGQFGSQNRQPIGSQNSQSFGNQNSQFGNENKRPFGSQSGQFGSQVSQEFESQSRRPFESQYNQGYGSQNSQRSGNRQPYDDRRDSSYKEAGYLNNWEPNYGFYGR